MPFALAFVNKRDGSDILLLVLPIKDLANGPTELTDEMPQHLSK
ncbi:hypothetical protein [Pedobacter agri]|nr:hypothetical protein [Pedobacter agri]